MSGENGPTGELVPVPKRGDTASVAPLQNHFVLIKFSGIDEAAIRSIGTQIMVAASKLLAENDLTLHSCRRMDETQYLETALGIAQERTKAEQPSGIG